MQMNLVYSTSVCMLKHITCPVKNALVVKAVKFGLTGMAAANLLEEKLDMFITGKSKMPRCFRYVKHLPCHYQNQ